MRKIRHTQAGRFSAAALALTAGLGFAALVPTPARSDSGAQAALTGGQTITVDQKLYSDDGHYALTMQGDGNLVEYNTAGAPQANQGQSTIGLGRAVWSTGTTGSGNSAVLEPNGALVVLTSAGQQIWSNNQSFPASQGCPALTLADDGNLREDDAGKALWSAGIIPNVLESGDVLKSNQRMWSPNEEYALYMQGDGNLVLYNSNLVAAWDSQTSGNPGAYAVMESDGELVVDDASGSELWGSQTSGHSGAQAWLGSDGDLTIYPAGQSPGNGTALFATGAANPGNGNITPPANPGSSSACPASTSTSTSTSTTTSSPSSGSTVTAPGITVTSQSPTTAQVTIAPPPARKGKPAPVGVKLNFVWEYRGSRTYLRKVAVTKDPRGTHWHFAFRSAGKRPRTTTRAAETAKGKTELIRWAEGIAYTPGSRLSVEFTRTGNAAVTGSFTANNRKLPTERR